MAERKVIIEVQVNNEDGLRNLGRLEKELIGVRKAQTDLRKEVRASGGATAEQERELGLLSSKAKALSGNIRELSNETSGLSAAGLRFRDKMAEANRAGLQAFGIGVVGVAGAVTGLISIMRNAGEIIKEFDSAQSNLAAILNTNKEGIQGLTAAAKQYGATTVFTASQVSELQTELAKLGFTQDQIQAATPAVLDLAAATGTSLANAATIAAQTLNAFGLTAADTGRVVDVIAQSANLSALDIDTFSAAMSNAAPAAKAVGVSIEEASAMLSALVDAGIPAEKAGTDLRNIFISLAAEGKTLDEAYAEIRGSTDSLTTAVGLFDQRAAGSALILADNTEKVARLKEGYDNAAGAAKAMAQTQLDNLQGDQLLLQSAWEGFVLSVEDGGGVISEVMRAITTSLTGVLTGLTDINSETTTMGQKFAGLAQTLTGLGGSAMRQFVESFYTPEELEAVAKGQQRVADTARVMAKGFDDNAASVGDLQVKLLALTKNRNEYEAIGTQPAVVAGYDKQIAAIKALIDQKKIVTEVTAEEVVATDAEVVKGETATKTTAKREAAVRLLTKAMRDFAAAQAAAQSGAAVEQLSPLDPQATPLQPVADRLLGDTVTAFDQAGEAAQTESAIFVEAQQAKINAINDMGNALSAFAGIAAKDSAEQKALATASALINTYLGVTQVLANRTVIPEPFGTISKIASISTVLATGLAAVRNIQGFDQGGIVGVHRDGQPIRRKNGDDRLVTAKVGEMFINEKQQREIRKRAGYDIFRAAGVPGSNNTGSYAIGGPVRGTALVNMPTAPSGPSFAELDQIRASASQQAKDPNIFVRVTDINKGQGRMAQVTERATL